MSDSFLLKHERAECIACGSCAKMDPKNWRMARDGLADLLSPIDSDAEVMEKELTTDFDLSMEVAGSCPVNIIHIVKDGNELI